MQVKKIQQTRQCPHSEIFPFKSCIEISHNNIDEWINPDTEVFHIIMDEDLISAIFEEPKDNDSDSSDDEIVHEKMFLS